MVAQQTHLGKQRIQDAQESAGLSNEAIARKVPVSEKTWRRWKERGEIPTSALPAVAKALRLELHQLNPETTVASDLAERLDQIEHLLRSLSAEQDEGFQETAESLARMASAIDELSGRIPAEGPRGRRRTAAH